jgi:hypothetical protein
MKKLLFANGYYKTARILPDPPDKKEPVQNWSNPPEIRQKYLLPARRFSNPPDFLKSGKENRHLATLT